MAWHSWGLGCMFDGRRDAAKTMESPRSMVSRGVAIVPNDLICSVQVFRTGRDRGKQRVGSSVGSIDSSPRSHLRRKQHSSTGSLDPVGGEKYTDRSVTSIRQPSHHARSRGSPRASSARVKACTSHKRLVVTASRPSSGRRGYEPLKSTRYCDESWFARVDVSACPPVNHR